MRKVIVNSTPLIALCKAGEFLLLKRMYEEITIPEAVCSKDERNHRKATGLCGLKLIELVVYSTYNDAFSCSSEYRPEG